jgi:hypothetical protein
MHFSFLMRILPSDYNSNAFEIFHSVLSIRIRCPAVVLCSSGKDRSLFWVFIGRRNTVASSQCSLSLDVEQSIWDGHWLSSETYHINSVR